MKRSWRWLSERWARPLTDDEIAQAVLDLCHAVLGTEPELERQQRSPELDALWRQEAPMIPAEALTAEVACGCTVRFPWDDSRLVTDAMVRLHGDCPHQPNGWRLTVTLMPEPSGAVLDCVRLREVAA